MPQGDPVRDDRATSRARSSPITPRLPLGLGAGATTALLAAMWCSPSPWTLALDAGTSFLGQTVPAFRSWANGTVPAWTDLLWGGFPLLADPTTAALYPPHAIAFVATLAAPLRFFDVVLALHAGVLAAGAAMLVHVLGAGRVVVVLAAVLALSSPIVHVHALENVAAFAALAWLPWILTAAEGLGRAGRPRFSGPLWLGWMGLAAQVLVGMPEHALYSGVIAAAWIALRGRALGAGERVLRIALLGGGALALAAPQVLTTLAYVGATTRAGKAPSAELASLWVKRPLALVVPGTMSDIPAFAGAATLVLAAAAVACRRAGALLLAGLAAVTFVLSLGPQAGLYAWLHRVPPFSAFRAPVKLYEFAELALAWTAALGVDALCRRGRGWRIAGLALAALALAEHAAFVSLDERRIVATLYRGAPSPDVLDQLAAAASLHPAKPGDPPPLVFDLTPPLGGAYVHSLGALVGVSALHAGDVSLLPMAHARLLYRTPTAAIATLLGVQRAIAPYPRCDRTTERWRWPVVERLRDFCVLENPKSRPRYEIVTNARAVRSFDEMIDAVHATTQAGPVPIATLPEVVSELHPGRVGMLETTPGRTWLLTSSPQRTLLLVRQSFVPGWRALVDGVPAPMYPAAGLYFAIALPPGSHRVMLGYTPRGLVPGAAIALAWLGVATVLTRRASRHP